MKKTKILFDISHGIHGTTGIQQDMRRVLSSLIKNDNFEIDFLVYDMVGNVNYVKFDVANNIINFGEIVAQSRLLYYFFNPVGESALGGGKYFGRIKRWRYRNFLIHNKKIETFKINRQFNELIYKRLLNDDSDAGVLNKFKNSNVLLTPFSTESLILGSMDKNYIFPELDTSEYDIAIFFQELPIKISANTNKIVRTYDLIQIFGPDVVFKADFKSNYQYKSIKACIEQNTVFTTISETVLDQLKLFFGDNLNCKMIPVQTSNIFEKKNDDFNILNFIEMYLSKVHNSKHKIPKDNFEYFLSVATIEPRKNIITAYQAFKNLKMEIKYKELKFVIVGKIGWNLNITYQNMFDDDDVIVLENVPTMDLPYLYSNSKALIYVAYQEGFGLPPAEAMVCGCPVILSDIAVHREIHGTSPLFVNPYSPEEISEKMKWILDSSNKSKLDNLIKDGLNHVKRYSMSRVEKEWLLFLKEISKVNQ